jgi:hypothetical protein
MAMQAVVPVPLQPQPRSKSLTTDKWREAFPPALNETRCKNPAPTILSCGSNMMSHRVAASDASARGRSWSWPA